MSGSVILVGPRGVMSSCKFCELQLKRRLNNFELFSCLAFRDNFGSCSIFVHQSLIIFIQPSAFLCSCAFKIILKYKLTSRSNIEGLFGPDVQFITFNFLQFGGLTGGFAEAGRIKQNNVILVCGDVNHEESC